MRCCLVLAAVLLSAPVTQAADADARRNVVLLIADDLGLTLGCYGDKAAKTPHLDALAKRGTRFTHAFAAVASCSPSRSVLYTGLQTHTSGQYGLAHATHNFHSRPVIKSLSTYLRAGGYRTGIIGKVHVLPKSVYDWDVERGGVNARSGQAMAKAAQAFLADCGDKPFCLVMGYTDPHRAARGFANEKPYPGQKEVKIDAKDVTVPYHLPDKPDVRADLAEYYTSVARLDQNVGLLLDMLKKAGRDKDTLVIFLSDNGIPFPGAKTTVYDAGIHLPLIVASPTAKKTGIVNRAMVSWVDVLPTILDWAGVAPPKPGKAKGKGAAAPAPQGRSFLPILEEEAPKGWDEVYASHTFHEVTMYYPMRAVRTRQYKYIRNLAHKLDYPFASDLHDSPSWQGVLKRGDKMMGQRSVAQFVNRPLEELYDVEKDPNELKNLADSAAHAKVLAEMRKKVRDWQTKTADPWVIKYQHE
jgi:N-sulfoglucosamine sulfohydrolase